MFRALLAALTFLTVPAWACDHPYEVMAREPVPVVDQPAYALEFDKCFDKTFVDVPEYDQLFVLDDLLKVAVRSGDIIVVRRMIEEKAALGGRASELPFGIFIYAAQNGYADIVRLMLESGASPNRDSDLVSPLFMAIREGQAETARILVDAGGDIRRHPDTPKGMTMIEEVIFSSGVGVAETIALLIEQGYDPSEPMSRGTLPIHTAAALGLGDVIRALVDGGADIEARNRQGHTPIETAAGTFNGIGALPALLELKAAAVDQALSRAELTSHDLNADYLRAVGDANDEQTVLDRALVVFIQRLRGDRIGRLLRAGANPNAFSGESHPLHVANCAPRVGETLLAFGADPDLARVDGNVPDWVPDCLAYNEETRRYISRLGFAQ